MITLSGKRLKDIDRNSELYALLTRAHQGLVEKNAATWGAQAAQEAAIRLNWVDFPETSRDLLPVLDALSAKFRNLSQVILCGMGGSSLGPQVIAQTFGRELFVLDSTDPQYISNALSGNLNETLVIISSKSGSTIETASFKTLFESQFSSAGLAPQDHMVIVTDPDSPLDKKVRADKYTVVNADPHVGGRFSVLGAFGLTPAALIGIDTSILIDSASETKEQILRQPSLVLDCAYEIITESKQYLSFTDAGAAMPGLSDWIEQLVAESTGKESVGRLPVVIEGPNSFVDGEALAISFAGESDLVVSGDLGSQFIYWEWVTALVGAGLAIDPFNQPNVQEAKEQTGALLTQWGGSIPKEVPSLTSSALEFFGGTGTPIEIIREFMSGLKNNGYIGIMAYLDRLNDSAIAASREILAQRVHRPVTFGWGPRFLHSTGQFHKGGQPNGIFLQVTGAIDKDIEIPEQSFTFNTLITAQALGDGNALLTRGLPVLRIHLRDRTEGISELLELLKQI
ncbi:unannotated protein [freshwater metagenome]|uniref:Unannotated protein n=1 Tax=freshwater metagenome TaxID=449393 RepID=A0A6J7XW95_9ZZZZ|nr:hypothetical protein [Actinomycetota bacterium]